MFLVLTFKQRSLNSKPLFLDALKPNGFAMYIIPFGKIT